MPRRRPARAAGSVRVAYLRVLRRLPGCRADTCVCRTRRRSRAARRLRPDPRRAEAARGLPGRRARRGRGRRRRRPTCRPTTSPTCRSSPSTRRAPPTSTRRCTSSAAAAATGCATPSPTSAAFVRPGGAIDPETHRRGETLYSPDPRTPLHPPSLSEGAASLLPGPGAAGAAVDPRPRRRRRADARSTYAAPLVRSRDRFDYAGCRTCVDGGTRRRAAAAARGGRQAADAARGRARRRQPADPRAGGRRGRRHVPARVPHDRCRSSRGTSRSP